MLSDLHNLRKVGLKLYGLKAEVVIVYAPTTTRPQDMLNLLALIKFHFNLGLGPIPFWFFQFVA